jgi:methyltransferase family protein
MNKIFASLQLVLALLITVLSRWKLWATREPGTATKNRKRLFEELIPKGLVGAELGVYKGNMSKCILEINQPQELHLIDPWWEYDKTWHWAVGDTSTARSFAIIILNMFKEIQNGQVQFHIGDDLRVLEAFPDRYFDWVYLDTTHEYNHTKREMAILRRKVKRDGIIAGDDWQNDPSHAHHGVCKAVSEFLENNPTWSLVFRENTQWAVKPEQP